MHKEEYVEAVKRNSQRLFLIAFSYTQSRSDAEDLMQNTFLKLWKHKGDFEDTAHLDKWLTRVCVNECKDFHRLSFNKSVPFDEGVNISYDDKHFNIDLYNAVASLSKKERMAIHLFYYEDLQISEIAQLMNIKQNTIKSMLSRSRKKLRAILGDEFKYE